MGPFLPSELAGFENGNWDTTFYWLTKEMGFTPRQIGELTLGQMKGYSEAIKKVSGKLDLSEVQSWMSDVKNGKVWS